MCTLCYFDSTLLIWHTTLRGNNQFVFFILFLPGAQQPHPLQCLAMQGKLVFAAYKNTVKAFRRGQEIKYYQGHEGEVHTLVPFGEHLVSIDDCNQLKLWHISTQGKVVLFITGFHFVSSQLPYSQDYKYPSNTNAHTNRITWLPYYLPTIISKCKYPTQI